MPSRAVIDLTQSDEDDQQSPSQLPRAPPKTAAAQLAASTRAGTQHETAAGGAAQTRKRRRLQQNTALHQQQQPELQGQALQGSSTAYDFLEDEDDASEARPAEHANAGKQRRLAMSSTQQQKGRDGGKRGRGAAAQQAAGKRKHRTRGASSSPDSAAGSTFEGDDEEGSEYAASQEEDEQEEEGGCDSEDEDEELLEPKGRGRASAHNKRRAASAASAQGGGATKRSKQVDGGRSGKHGRIGRMGGDEGAEGAADVDGSTEGEQEGKRAKGRGSKSGPGGKEGAADASRRRGAKGKASPPPAKGPLQLTLSQFAKPQSRLQTSEPPTKVPSSSQHQPPHFHAASPGHHAQLTDGAPCDQQPHHTQHRHASQGSQGSPTPTRPPLRLSHSSQQLHHHYHHHHDQQRHHQHQQHQNQQNQQPLSRRSGPQQGGVPQGLSGAVTRGAQGATRAVTRGAQGTTGEHKVPQGLSGAVTRGAQGGTQARAAAATATKARQRLPVCPSSSHGQSGACADPNAALWCDKHAPTTTSALVVHRKKVEEVRSFLVQQEQLGPMHRGSRMLVATGPVGCGKSTTIRLLASELGYQVVEYTPPAPTLWSELQHQTDPDAPRSLGPSYMSKLDDFEAFVSRAKYPALPLASRGGGAPDKPASQQQLGSAAGSHKKLLLIDDLPHVHDTERSRRLAACLGDLAATARGPVVLICTEGDMGSGREGGGNVATGGAKGLNKDVMAAVEAGGAMLLTFNPLTTQCLTKVVQQVAAAEQCTLSPDAAASIAGLADGDVRNAIQTLQALFAGHHAAQPKQSGSRRSGGRASGGRGSGGRAANKLGTQGGGLDGSEAARIASTQRDLGLDIFHALGKLLYNKREGGDAGAVSKRKTKAEDAADAAIAAVRAQAEAHAPSKAVWMPSLSFPEELLHESLHRPPSKNDPEAIITQCGLDPIQVAAFLHENYLNFISEDAIEDVSQAATYMSDAAFMASYQRGATSSEFSGGFWGVEESAGAKGLTSACASSVAARGLMFANAHPAPRRWLPLQAPAQNRAERARSDNAERVQATSACLAAWHGTLAAGGCAAAVCSEVMPWLRALTCSPDYSALTAVMPSSWALFTMASNQNAVVRLGGGQAGVGGKEWQEQVQRLEWAREQEGAHVDGGRVNSVQRSGHDGGHGMSGVEAGEGGMEEEEEEDPIGD